MVQAGAQFGQCLAAVVAALAKGGRRQAQRRGGQLLGQLRYQPLKLGEQGVIYHARQPR